MNAYTPRHLEFAEICRRMQTNPDELIREEDERYRHEVETVTRTIADAFSGRCLVLLSGPSASGKTTTAHNIERGLQVLGRHAYVVSLDNFYRGYGHAPQLPDGSFDYEAVEALDLPLLETCMQELLISGCTQLPIFDFVTHTPSGERRTLCVEKDAVVIFEGIHALNPLLRKHLSSDAVFTVFINVMSRIERDGESLLTRRDLRLTRRLIRDVRFRNSSMENTMDMWRQVVRGEDLYLFPFADTADATFDTTHAYESAMLGAELLPLLRAVPTDSRYYEPICRLADALSQFSPLSVELLPRDSLLREFIG